MGSLRFDPNAPQVRTPPAGGGLRFDPNQQPAPAASGGAVSPGRFDPNPPPPSNGAAQSGWGIDWSKPGGQVTMPQSVQDFGDIAGNEASTNLVGLKARADAARQRLGPIASSTADIAGNILSPTTLLNAVPFIGPELAGGAHEGIKSYAAGNDWKTIGEDTLGGIGAGLTGHGAAALAPKVLPQLTKQGVQMGFAYGANKLGLGHILPESLGPVMQEVAPFLSVYGLAGKAGDWAGSQVERLASSPMARQAIQNLILGGGSAARTAGGPWDQWIPGQ